MDIFKRANEKWKMGKALLNGQDQDDLKLRAQITSSVLSFKESSTGLNDMNCIRQRLVLSLLSAKPVKIDEIRSRGGGILVGLRSYEMSFVQLLLKISNGSEVKISETGTSIYFKPGLVIGNIESAADEIIFHECDESKPISYYLEPLLLLAPFSKKPFNLILQGRIAVNEDDEKTTQNETFNNNSSRKKQDLFDSNANNYENGNKGEDTTTLNTNSESISSKSSQNSSVYKIKYAALPIMTRFGLEPELEIMDLGKDKIKVKFRCNVKKQLMTLRKRLGEDMLTTPKNGQVKVKKIRGNTYAFGGLTSLAPQLLNRVISSTKETFLPYISDIYITLDSSSLSNASERKKKWKQQQQQQKHPNATNPMNLMSKDSHYNDSKERENSKSSRGYGISLFAETTSGIIYSSESYTDQQNQQSINQKSPEEIGILAAKKLLHEICRRTGDIDSSFQWLILGYMALSAKDISSIVLGKEITPYTVQFLRDLKTFFGVTFKVDEIKIRNKKKRKTVDSKEIIKRAKISSSNHSDDEFDTEDDEIEENSDDSADDQFSSNSNPTTNVKSTSFTVYELSCLGSGYINLNKTSI